jgi:hypothetical protein
LLEIGRLPLLGEIATEDLEEWFRRNEEAALRQGAHPQPGPCLVNGSDE